MVTQIIGTSACQEHFFPQKSATAARLGPAARKELSLRVLGRTESVSGLAQSHGVSRKFLYQQAAKASKAIDKAFEPSAKNNEILFYLPVTKNWLRQFVLVLLRFVVCYKITAMTCLPLSAFSMKDSLISPPDSMFHCFWCMPFANSRT